MVISVVLPSGSPTWGLSGRLAGSEPTVLKRVQGFRVFRLKGDGGFEERDYFRDLPGELWGTKKGLVQGISQTIATKPETLNITSKP